MLKRWKGQRWFHAHETARFDALNGLPLASFRRRAFAYGIDLLIVGLVAVLFSWPQLIHAAQGSIGQRSMEWMHRIFEEIEHLIESVVYFAVALKLGKGQTPGKKLMKIRVVSLTDDHIGWWQATERALGYGASLLEGGFGFFQYFLNRNRMCVHDRIAETIVVDMRARRQEAPLVFEEHPQHVDELEPSSSPTA